MTENKFILTPLLLRPPHPRVRVGRVFRDGLKAEREALGARSGDPRCTEMLLGPVAAGRISMMKSLPSSLPSWRPVDSLGYSHGARRRKRRWACRRTPAPTGSIPESTCCFYGVR